MQALPAQKDAEVPARPHLESGTDSNSAAAIYRHGLRVINDDPQESYRSFYWATRIEPTSAESWYALWVAKQLIMSSRDMAVYQDYRFTQRSPMQLGVDSLLFRAYALDPFLYQRLERPLRQRQIGARIADRNPATRNLAAVNASLGDNLNRMSYEGWILYA